LRPFETSFERPLVTLENDEEDLPSMR